MFPLDVFVGSIMPRTIYFPSSFWDIQRFYWRYPSHHINYGNIRHILLGYLYIVYSTDWSKSLWFSKIQNISMITFISKVLQSYFTFYKNCLVSFKYTFFVLCSPLTVRVFIFDVCLFRKLEYNYIHRKNYWRRQHGDRTSMFVIICTLTHLSQLMMGGVCERNFNA